MGADFSTLEKLYARGVHDINGKDYINGTNSNLTINSNRETFLPDNRFVKVDAPYMRRQIDKDTLELIQHDKYFNKNLGEHDSVNSEKNSLKNKVSSIIGSKITAGIIGTLAMLFSGRYILKKLHIIK